MDHFFYQIPGWFRYENLYHYMVDEATENSHFVEVGAWLGRSTSFMAVEIINSNKKIQFDVVDTWQGSAEHQDTEYVLSNTLYEKFLINTHPIHQHINPIRMASLDAAKLYPDNSLDFVMLDASHEYQDVKNDIMSWFPKLKSGAVLARDDFELEWPGVIKAVLELFPNVRIIDHRLWVVIKN